jgi:hypothetical protein
VVVLRCIDLGEGDSVVVSSDADIEEKIEKKPKREVEQNDSTGQSLEDRK